MQNGDTVSFGKKGDGTLVVCCSACKPERPVVPGPKGFKGKAAKAAASKEAKETDGAERKRKRPSNASAPTSKIAKPTKVRVQLSACWLRQQRQQPAKKARRRTAQASISTRQQVCKAD